MRDLKWIFLGILLLIVSFFLTKTPSVKGAQYGDNGNGQVIWNDISLRGRPLDGSIYMSFPYATSTAWSGTSTVPLGTAYVAEMIDGIQCFTDTGTVNVALTDGTDRMETFNASTTVGTVTLSTNNTFTAAEKRFAEIGTPASSPTYISCTLKKHRL